MSELDPRLERRIEPLREPPAASPEATRRLLDALREQHRRIASERAAPPPAHALERLRRPIVLTPVHAAVWTAALVLLTSLVWLGPGRSILRRPARSLTPASGPATSPRQARGGARVPVQFVLVARDAERVSVVGDFNDWTPAATPLTRGSDGLWSAVVALPEGRYAYSYVVDGSDWRADPAAPVQIDDYGRPSSFVLVSRPERMQ